MELGKAVNYENVMASDYRFNGGTKNAERAFKGILRRAKWRSELQLLCLPCNGGLEMIVIQLMIKKCIFFVRYTMMMKPIREERTKRYVIRMEYMQKNQIIERHGTNLNRRGKRARY